MKKLLVLALLSGWGACAWATKVEVPADGTHTLTAAENVQDVNSPVWLNNGSTLEVPASLGANLTLKACVKVVSGSATLKFESGITSVTMTGGLYAPGEAALTVVGVGAISFGRAYPEGENTTINTPPLDIGTLTFADAGATGLVLVNKSTVRRAPTTCGLQIASGAQLALSGTDTLAPFGYGDTIELDDFDLVLLDQTAISSNATIRVAPGRRVDVKPCNFQNDWQWAGTAVGEGHLPTIELGGEGAKVVFRNNTGVTFTSCPVTGTGDVIVKPDNGNNKNVTFLYGPFSYTGVFAVDNASVAKTYSYAWEEGTRSLRLAKNASCQCNGVASFDCLEMDTSATLPLNFNSDVTIGDVIGAGALTLKEDVAGGKFKFAGSIPTGFAVDVDATISCSFKGGEPTDGFVCPTPDGYAYRWPDADGVIDCAGLTLGGGYPAATLYAQGAKLINVGSGLAVRSATGGGVTVVPAGLASSLRADEGETITYGASEIDWKANLMLWIDPSQSRTYPVCTKAEDDATLEGGRVFRQMDDVRPEQTKYALRNSRDGAGTARASVNWQVYPHLVPNACNGLACISLGQYEAWRQQNYEFADGTTLEKAATTEARRVLFSPDGKVDASAPTAVGAVTMVFGSQEGGGIALVGTLDATFVRAGTTLNSPIANTDAHKIYVNGEEVNPTTAKFSGGWDVITVEMSGEKLSAFGWGGKSDNNDYTRCGGQKYGEILVFSEVPSQDQRVAAERYLAKKWGLAEKYADVAQAVALSGKGTVVTDGAAIAAKGRFSGMVELHGGSLAVPAVKLPAGVEALPKASLAAWFDPDDAANVLYTKDTDHWDRLTDPDRIFAVYDKMHPDRQDGDYYLFGVKARRPIGVRQAHGDGPERTWIEFRNFGNMGSNLRFMKLPLPDLSTEVVTAQAFTGAREFFIVQDSSRGGGTPVNDKINTPATNLDGMKVIPRRTTDPKAAIWSHRQNSTWTADVVTKGVTRVNGAVVDGKKRGFTGGPELFNFSTTAAFSPLAFADLYNSQTVDKQAYEMMGEILVYNEVLSDADRAKVEEYLNWKWLGVMPEGCNDFREATVTGTGAVSGAKLDDLPQFDASFAGSVRATDSGDFTVSVTPKTGAVEGARLTPEAELDLPAAATVTVRIVGRGTPKNTPYVLLEGKSFVRATDWSLNIVSDRPGYSGTLRVEGNRLLLDLCGPGLVIVVE